MKKLLTLLALGALAQAETMQFTEYVVVSESRPQYQLLSQREPYQECYERERAPKRVYHDNVTGSVIGGAIGGVLGHQVGRGKGKDAATIGGAILGTIVGGNVITNEQRYRPQRVYPSRQECTTRYRQGPRRQELVGYENIAYYKGKRIVKFSSQPLRRIPLQVRVDF